MRRLEPWRIVGGLLALYEFLSYLRLESSFNGLELIHNLIKLGSTCIPCTSPFRDVGLAVDDRLFSSLRSPPKMQDCLPRQ